MEKVSAEIYVKGQVQGVNFRGFTKARADELELTGYCRNLSDGRVLIKVEGGRRVIEELIKYVGKGPPAASVIDIEVKWITSIGAIHDFQIRF